MAARLVVLSYFAPGALPRLLDAAEKAHLPARSRVYVGSYGVGADIATKIAAAGCHYAPMFQLQPGWYWERRRLSRKDTRTLHDASPGAARLAGPLPELPRLLRLSSSARVSWAVELGARFRDELRVAQRNRVRVDAWQLDEIQAEAVGPLGRGYRELTRGALRGLVFGRAALGDRARQGLVWWAHTSFALAGRRITPELTAFWRILNRAAFGLIGEEYPDFSGDARAAARAHASGQRALRRGGPVRKALARKYVVGMSPGYRRAPGLGGNVHGWPRTRVNRWVEEYVEARAGAGIAGVAEFNFRFENSRAWVMQDTMRSIARAL